MFSSYGVRPADKCFHVGRHNFDKLQGCRDAKRAAPNFLAVFIRPEGRKEPVEDPVCQQMGSKILIRKMRVSAL